jgi:hypothetical protein
MPILVILSPGEAGDESTAMAKQPPAYVPQKYAESDESDPGDEQGPSAGDEPIMSSLFETSGARQSDFIENLNAYAKGEP